MTAAKAAPMGQNVPVPEPLPGLDPMEHDVFVLTVAVVVHSPPSQLVDEFAVAVALICVVSIELSAVTHWPTLPVLT
jgi:hypothetical protein